MKKIITIGDSPHCQKYLRVLGRWFHKERNQFILFGHIIIYCVRRTVNQQPFSPIRNNRTYRSHRHSVSLMHTRGLDYIIRKINVAGNTSIFLRNERMIRFPFLSGLPVLIINRRIITNQIVFVIIENIHVFGIFGMSERALEVSRQIIHINLLRCSAVDKHFIVVFIQNNSADKIIFFGTLSLPVYFPYGFTGFSVINKNVAIVCPVLHQQILVTYIHHAPLSHKFITCLQRNVFHIHKILKNYFLLGMFGGNIHRDHRCLLFFRSASYTHSHQEQYRK